jgi:hypothetical protein
MSEEEVHLDISSRTRLAGWMVLKIPVSSQYFRLIRALIGRKASTPGGRVTVIGSLPWACWTKKMNLSATLGRFCRSYG